MKAALAKSGKGHLALEPGEGVTGTGNDDLRSVLG